MALLDEGETDWKVIVVDVQDPLASKLNDIEDVERHLPGLIRATNEWFRSAFSFVEFDSPLNAIYCRIYKIPDGKPENAFAFSGEAKNIEYATEIINECHEAWRRLISGKSPAVTPSYNLSMFVAFLLLWQTLMLTYLKPQCYAGRHAWICQDQRSSIHPATR